MTRDQYYAWMFFPTSRDPQWNCVSMLARGVGAELWMRIEGKGEQLRPEPGQKWEELVLAWLFVEGQERRSVRRALAELVKRRLIAFDAGGALRVRYTRPGHPAKPYLRMPIPASTRQLVIERDGSTCRLCGEPVELDQVDLDHLVPVSLGGTNHADNLRVAHASCNRARGNRESN